MIIILILAVGLVPNISSAAHASLVWQQATEIPAQPARRLYVHNDTLYIASGPRIYRFDHQASQWDTLAELDPGVTLTSAIIQVGDRLFAGTFNMGVFESDNNGASWTQRNAGLSGLAGLGALDIADFTVRGDSLYVGTVGARVFAMNLTTPSNWVSYSDGIPDNTSANIISLYEFDHYLLTGAGLNSSLFRNAPDSASWNEVPFSAFDPRGAGMLDMTSRDELVYGVTSNGLFISRDSGATWERYVITNFLIGAGSVAADNDAVYGSIWLPIFGSFYFSSTGSNWQVMDSVPSKLTFNIRVLGGRLYAGRDDGLWYAELNPTDVGGGDPSTPKNFALAQNYPNPFNPTTRIEFTLPRASLVTVDVINLLGQKVKTLLRQRMSAGRFTTSWDGRDSSGDPVATGVYFYRLTAGDVVETRKMMLLR